MSSLQKAHVFFDEEKAYTPEAQLNQAWQRIVSLKQANQDFEKTLQAFELACDEVLAEPELELQVALSEHAIYISRFLTRKSMTQWQRATLMDWVTENLHALSISPYCQDDLLAAAAEAFERDSAALGPDLSQEDMAELEEILEAAEALFSKPDIDTEYDFGQADLFEELAKAAAEEGDEFASFWEDMYEQVHQQYEEQFEQREAQQKAEANRLQDVLKKSSINGLFRKLARILHPDREQDEELKALRHQQMSELLSARDQNDVFTVLTMYQEHTGQSPLQEVVSDTEALLPLLAREAREIEAQREHLIDKTERRRALYDAFYDDNDAVREAMLDRHLRAIDMELMALEEVVNTVTSLAKLRPYLEARHDMMQSKIYW